MKLMSLFDGSGGFPLAGAMSGIIPVLASEIEPYPIAVTRSRFPDMTHLGDVSAINGAEVYPVDVITFGSPCQDLSVAGKRAGLEGERSGLFMEAIRIVKEMRGATDGKYPTFILWENVPGAFSSNKGEDFRVVLEEIIKVVEPGATMPPADKGRWPYADVYVGEGWSLAYRTFDAQYWGVPQRRRRIYLVADFRGERAGEILFECEGMRGDLEESGTQRQAASRHAEDCTRPADRKVCCMKPIILEHHPNDSRVRIDGSGTVQTLTSRMGTGGGNVPMVMMPFSKSRRAKSTTDFETWKASEVSNTINTFDQGDVRATDVVVCIQGNVIDRSDNACANGAGWRLNQCYTLNTIDRPAVVYPKTVPKAVSMEVFHCNSAEERTAALKARDYKDPQIVVMSERAMSMVTGERVANTLAATDYKGVQILAIDRAAFNQGENAKYDFQIDGGVQHRRSSHAVPVQSVIGSLYASDYKFPQQQQVNEGKVVIEEMENEYIVRRLTPTECCRLQGFPDGWAEIDPKDDFTDEEYAFWLDVRNTWSGINGREEKEYTKEQMLTWYNKLHTDSAEYKMWGNGISLPTAYFVLSRMKEQFEEEDND